MGWTGAPGERDYSGKGKVRAVRGTRASGDSATKRELKAG